MKGKLSELNENMCNASVHRARIYVDHVAVTFFMSDCSVRLKGESADADHGSKVDEEWCGACRKTAQAGAIVLINAGVGSARAASEDTDLDGFCLFVVFFF